MGAEALQLDSSSMEESTNTGQLKEYGTELRGRYSRSYRPRYTKRTYRYKKPKSYKRYRYTVRYKPKYYKKKSYTRRYKPKYYKRKSYTRRYKPKYYKRKYYKPKYYKRKYKKP